MTDTASSPGGDAQAGIVKWNKKQRLNRKVQPLLFLCRRRIFRYPFPFPVSVSVSFPFSFPFSSSFPVLFPSLPPGALRPARSSLFPRAGRARVPYRRLPVPMGDGVLSDFPEGRVFAPVHSRFPGLSMRTSSEHRATSVAGGFSGLSVLQAVPFPATFRSAGFTPSGGAGNR